jgi:hypothetical protein
VEDADVNIAPGTPLKSVNPLELLNVHNQSRLDASAHSGSRLQAGSLLATQTSCYLHLHGTAWLLILHAC